MQQGEDICMAQINCGDGSYGHKTKQNLIRQEKKHDKLKLPNNWFQYFFSLL